MLFGARTAACLNLLAMTARQTLQETWPSRRACGAQVHYGMVMPDGEVQLNYSDPYGLTVVPVHEDCGVWLHVVNLFVGRQPCDEAGPDTAWRWVLDTIEGLE